MNGCYFLTGMFICLILLIMITLPGGCGGEDYWDYIFKDPYGLGASIRSKGPGGVVLCGSQGCKEVSWDEMYRMYPSDKEVIDRMRKDE